MDRQIKQAQPEIEPPIDLKTEPEKAAFARTTDDRVVERIVPALNDPALEARLAGIGEPSVQTDRFCLLLKKLGSCFQSNRKQAENELELELLHSPSKVMAFLKAGQLATDPNVRDACSRLLSKLDIDTQWRVTQGKVDSLAKAGGAQPFLRLIDPLPLEPLRADKVAFRVSEFASKSDVPAKIDHTAAGARWLQLEPNRGQFDKGSDADTKPLIDQSCKLQRKTASGGLSDSEHTEFQRLIGAADELSVPSLRADRARFLRQTGHTGSIEPIPEASKALEELKHPEWISAKVRSSYAQALAHAGETAKAQKFLMEAMQKDRRIVHDEEFQQVFNDVGGRHHKGTAQTFLACGGTDGALKTVERRQQEQVRASDLIGKGELMIRPRGILTPEDVRRRSTSERAVLMDSWSKVLCGANGPEAADAMRSRLELILRDPKLSGELAPSLAKHIDAVLASHSKVYIKAAVNVAGLLAQQGEPEAVRLLVRVAGADISDAASNFPAKVLPDYISDPFERGRHKRVEAARPAFGGELSASAEAAKKLVSIAREQPARQTELLKAVLKDWARSGGDQSKGTWRTWCSEQLFLNVSVPKLAEQAHAGDDDALWALTYLAPGRKEAAGLILAMGADPALRDKVLNSIAYVANQAGASHEMLPLMAVVLSGNSKIAEKLSPDEALKVIIDASKTGNIASLQFLMSELSDGWLRANHLEAKHRDDQGSLIKAVEELSAVPALKDAFVTAYLKLNDQRRAGDIRPEIFAMVLTATTGVKTDKSGSLAPAFKVLEERARAGDIESMRLLCLAAAGAGGPAGCEAKENLQSLSDNPKRAREVVYSLLDAYRLNGDSGVLLMTVGEISARRMITVPSDVRQTLTDAFKFAAHWGKETYEKPLTLETLSQHYSYSAIAGYMAIYPPEKWDAAAINEITDNASMGLSFWLRQNIKAIPQQQGRELTDKLIERISLGANSRNEFRRDHNCASTLAALTPFVKVDDVTKLVESAGYDSSDSRHRLAIGQTFLSWHDSGSPLMKAKVIEALTTNGWSEILQWDVRDRIAQQIKTGKLSLDVMDERYASVRNLNFPVPVELQLKRLGVHPEYSDEQLKKLADDMVARHGLETVNLILANTVAYNCASQRVQNLLRSDSKPVIGPDGHFVLSADSSGPLNMTAIADALACGTPIPEFDFLARLTGRLVELNKVSMDEQERLAKCCTRVTDELKAKSSHMKSIHGGSDGIPEVQAKVTDKVRILNTQAQLLVPVMMSVSEDAQSISASLISHRYFTLMSQGHTQQANDLALTALADPTARLPQSIGEQFRRGGVWKGLLLEGNVSAAGIGDLLADPRRYDSALAMLRNYRPAFGKYGGDWLHSPERAAVLERAVFAQVQNVISKDPSMERLAEAGKKLVPFTHIADSVKHLMNGRASESTAKYVHGELKEMKKVLDSIDPKDIAAVNRIIRDLDTLSDSGSADKAVREFAGHLSSQLSKLVSVFDANSKVGRELRVLCDVKESDLLEPSFWEKVGIATVYTLVAVATAVAVVVTLGASLPVILVVVPTVCFLVNQGTAEGVRAAGYGEGSILGAQLRGKVVVDKKTGQMRLQTMDECVETLARTYAEELAFNAIALPVSKFGAFTRRVTGLGRTETLKAGSDQTSQMLARVGVEKLSTPALYRREVGRQLGPGMAMTGASLGASEVGSNEKYAGLGVAFLQALVTKGRAPQKFRYHGERVLLELKSRGMVEETPNGVFLTAGPTRVKLEQVPVLEKAPLAVSKPVDKATIPQLNKIDGAKSEVLGKRGTGVTGEMVGGAEKLAHEIDATTPAPKSDALVRAKFRIQLAQNADSIRDYLRFPTLEALPEAYRHAEIKRMVTDISGNSGGEKYRASVRMPDGSMQRVVIRAVTDEGAFATTARLRKELAAQDLNKMLALDNGFPATTRVALEIKGEKRQFWLQEANGETLEHALYFEAKNKFGGNSSDDVVKVVAQNPQLRSQVEQAFFERLLYGDGDNHALNFVVKQTANGQLRVQNIDLDYGFPTTSKPQWLIIPTLGVNRKLHAEFSERALSPEVLQKVKAFVNQYDTPTGRAKLAEIGLERSEINGLLARARWFADNGRFPKAYTSKEWAEVSRNEK